MLLKIVSQLILSLIISEKLTKINSVAWKNVVNSTHDAHIVMYQ